MLSSITSFGVRSRASRRPCWIWAIRMSRSLTLSRGPELPPLPCFGMAALRTCFTARLMASLGVSSPSRGFAFPRCSPFFEPPRGILLSSSDCYVAGGAHVPVRHRPDFARVRDKAYPNQVRFDAVVDQEMAEPLTMRSVEPDRRGEPSDAHTAVAPYPLP